METSLAARGERREGILSKGHRLAEEGAVENLGGGCFKVHSNLTHDLRYRRNPESPLLDCSCRASSFGDYECSHRVAVEEALFEGLRVA